MRAEDSLELTVGARDTKALPGRCNTGALPTAQRSPVPPPTVPSFLGVIHRSSTQAPCRSPLPIRVTD
ncbi:hypothetical protein SKAU_G00240520 [Synaphobranchus kaupii]|uniref:Uncharacterized protein n=1 Tax=Synaphobranchus kaupii TaxID=118154 RepID=A0A9Q1F7G7_SYNKA|nr:hypothetical protein SKAU_G00240520 [Synaphobranchus kaupii]